MKKLFFTVLLFFTASIVNAGQINAIGYLSCGNFLSYCEKSKLDLDCQAQTKWAQGYISGVSWESDITFDGNTADQDNVKYALIKYCRENPLKDIRSASENIFKQIK